MNGVLCYHCSTQLQVVEERMPVVNAPPAEATKPKFRKDYTPTPYLVDSVSLEFILNEDFTTVTAVQKVRPNHTGTFLWS